MNKGFSNFKIGETNRVLFAISKYSPYKTKMINFMSFQENEDLKPKVRKSFGFNLDLCFIFNMIAFIFKGKWNILEFKFHISVKHSMPR